MITYQIRENKVAPKIEQESNSTLHTTVAKTSRTEVNPQEIWLISKRLK